MVGRFTKLFLALAVTLTLATAVSAEGRKRKAKKKLVVREIIVRERIIRPQAMIILRKSSYADLRVKVTESQKFSGKILSTLSSESLR